MITDQEETVSITARTDDYETSLTVSVVTSIIDITIPNPNNLRLC